MARLRPSSDRGGSPAITDHHELPRIDRMVSRAPDRMTSPRPQALRACSTQHLADAAACRTSTSLPFIATQPTPSAAFRLAVDPWQHRASAVSSTRHCASSGGDRRDGQQHRTAAIRSRFCVRTTIPEERGRALRRGSSTAPALGGIAGATSTSNSLTAARRRCARPCDDYAAAVPAVVPRRGWRVVNGAAAARWRLRRRGQAPFDAHLDPQDAP